MPTHLGWGGIAVRLLFTVVGGAALGLNRSESDHPAGLRTSILATLAAALSMLQANLLISTAGKASDSFVVLDLMRLPLGVLTGVGFIGAGAILRRGDHARGVTTAATLWFATLLGLCFGGGQLALGSAALAIGLATLWLLKAFERRLRRWHHGRLHLTARENGLDGRAVQTSLERAGMRLSEFALSLGDGGRCRCFSCTVRFWDGPKDDLPPAAVQALSERPDVARLRWTP